MLWINIYLLVRQTVCLYVYQTLFREGLLWFVFLSSCCNKSLILLMLMLNAECFTSIIIKQPYSACLPATSHFMYLLSCFSILISIIFPYCSAIFHHILLFLFTEYNSLFFVVYLISREIFKND